jgi:hypothetical protein
VKIHQLDNIAAPHLTGTPKDDCNQTSAGDWAHKSGMPFDAAGNLPWVTQPESKRITKATPTVLRALAEAGKLRLNGLTPSELGVVIPKPKW